MSIKLKQLKSYHKLYKNWLHVLYSIHNMSTQDNKINLKLRNGKTQSIELKDIFDYTFKNYYVSPDGCVKINNFKFKLNNGDSEIYNGDIGATFIKEDYKWLKPKENTVIDIGANIGDSSIYFAWKGAKQVIALEPYPYSYKLAMENILINGFNEKIFLLNAGYGKNGEMIVGDQVTGTGNELVSSKKGTPIKIYSIKTLLEKYRLDSVLLKMDCEGCEYNLLNEDDNTLKKIKRIQIEYHYGYERLKNKLEGLGFKVRYTEPVVGAENKNMYMGYIYARQ